MQPPAPAAVATRPRPQGRARALAAELNTDAAQNDADGAFPTLAIEALRQAGLLAAPVATAFGGEGLGDPLQTLELLHTLAAIGRGSLVVGRLYEGHVNALQLIAAHGTPAQVQRAASDALEGHLFGVWNTEAQAKGLKITGSPSGMSLQGGKTFASGVGHVTRALVTAATQELTPSAASQPPGWQMLLLATDRQPPRVDTTFWKPLGMRGSGSHAADFSGHVITADSRIGAPGDYYREPAFSAGAIRFAAVQQGGVEAVFDETRRYLAALGRTDDLFQRARLGDMAWRVESGRHWLEAAARLYAEPSWPCPPPAEAGDAAQREQRLAHARMMRSAIAANALQVMALSDLAVGARGLLQPEPFERLHRDLTHYLRQPAPDAALVEAGRYVLEDSRPAAALWP